MLVSDAVNPVPARSVSRTIPRLPETRPKPWPHIATLTPAITAVVMLGTYLTGGNY